MHIEPASSRLGPGSPLRPHPYHQPAPHRPLRYHLIPVHDVAVACSVSSLRPIPQTPLRPRNYQRRSRGTRIFEELTGRRFRAEGILIQVANTDTRRYPVIGNIVLNG
jgi:hypothetical protein